MDGNCQIQVSVLPTAWCLLITNLWALSGRNLISKTLLEIHKLIYEQERMDCMISFHLQAIHP